MGNGPLDRVDLAGRCASCAGLWGLGDRALGLAAERDRHALADGGGYSREHAQGVALVVGVFEAGDDGLGRTDARGQSFLRESVSFAEVVNGLCDADGYRCGANRAGPARRFAKKLIDRGRAVVPRCWLFSQRHIGRRSVGERTPFVVRRDAPIGR